VDYTDNKGKHTVHIDNPRRPQSDHTKVPRSGSFHLTGKARTYDVRYESNYPSPGYHVE
jgi:hypothetical protein